MTTDHELDRVLGLYFERGPIEINDRVVASALETIDDTGQVRPRLRRPRRFLMQHAMRFAAAAAAAVAVVAGAAALLNQTTPPPVAVTPSPPAATDVPTPTSDATARPSQTAPPAGGAPLIAYVRRETDPNTGLLTYKWHVWTVEPDGSNRRRLNDDVSVDTIVLGWTPDGSRVMAFAPGYPNVEPETSPGIYAFDIATGEATQLTVCEAPCVRDSGPQLSRDGSTLLVVRETADATGNRLGSSILLVDMATGRETELVGTRLDGSFRSCGNAGSNCLGPWIRGPSLSPDGGRIAYAQMEEVADEDPGVVRGATIARGDIILMDADGSDGRTLDLGGTSASDPVWSPDGSRIVFGSYVEDYVFGTNGRRDTLRVRRDIYTIAADGTDLRQLTDYGHATGATWTSDGRIRFIQLESDGAGDYVGDFWTMDAAGGDGQRLTDFGPDAYDVELSSLTYPVVQWRPDPLGQ
ncbi:MAG TPA: hypothetical protein VFV72_02905 [Candidatus Limnocylindrales bacterium]|nr:hypothetical protein [Candidatus Limnocylindrales bacterium]